ncbi:MAG: phosphoglucosamine mutase [Candidatus Lokiarchaeota archaeon]|nr:phosphoglucosamine mutase [Candidatus Harpocratesius repetitus]
MFGTCGIRKKFSTYDKSEQTFTPNMALRLGEAIGTAINSGKVVIGRDIRTAALAIEYAIISGLVSTGCKVYTIGMVTTPTLAMSIDFLDADCGVMITASHNPPEYIGVKLWNKGGLGFSPEQEAEIETIYNERAFVRKEYNRLGTVTQIFGINDRHIEHIMKRIQYHCEDDHFTVIVDPGNGSASEIGPKLLSALGLDFITLNSQPDGTFPGRLSEPSPKNLEDLRLFIQHSSKIQMGIAFDGDADRVVFLDEKGNVVEPIRILTFLAKEYINSKYPTKSSRPQLSVVTPVNSSGVIEAVLEPLGVNVYRTKVGDINVSQAMLKNNAFLGGENCGVYIWPEKTDHKAPDSLATIAILLKYLSHYKCKFSELFADIPEFPYLKKNVELEEDLHFRSQDYLTIAEKLENNLKKAGYSDFKRTLVDGVHLRFKGGWILIRKSGTTPILRITAESQTSMNETEKLVQIGIDTVNSLIPLKIKE